MLWLQERYVAKGSEIGGSGNVLKNVIRTRKSSGVTELTSLTGNDRML